MRASQQGMTLVEVLVALAILAAVAAAVLTLIAQDTRFIASSEDRLLASILLDNRLTEDLARAAPLERGENAEEEAFAGRQWLLERNVVETEVESLVRIEMAVRAAPGGQVLVKASTLKKEGR